MTTYSIPFEGISIGVDFHPAAGPARAALLYFHGGGLLYGSRRDLPQEYIRAITERGFHLFACDYLLAPESPLEDIHRSVDAAAQWFLSHRREFLGREHPYALFGRSAGGYLALSLAYRLTLRQECEPPAALWCFYGYNTLLHPLFLHPSPHYKAMPQVPPSSIPNFSQQAPRSHAPIEERYFLYVHARQQGSWPQLLSRGDPDALRRCAVPQPELSRLPPAFLTASTADGDVPFSFSKTLSREIPKSCLLPVFGLEHDYDRDPSREESAALYQRALAWLEALLEEPAGGGPQ